MTEEFEPFPNRIKFQIGEKYRGENGTYTVLDNNYKELSLTVRDDLTGEIISCFLQVRKAEYEVAYFGTVKDFYEKHGKEDLSAEKETQNESF